MPTQPSIVRIAFAVVVTGSVLGGGGCVQVDPPPGADRPTPRVTTSGGVSGGPTVRDPAAVAAGRSEPELIELPSVPNRPNVLDTLAPCDAKLDNLGGLLLNYYAWKKTLPARLEDLSRVATPLMPADFTCPFAGQPYVYVRQTINPALGGLKLVAYAPAAGKDGLRRALLVGFDSSKGMQTPAANTVRLSEAQLQAQLKRIPAAAADPAVDATTPNP